MSRSGRGNNLNAMKKAIQQNPFLFFLLFTFAFSWLTSLPALLVKGEFGALAFLASFGPAIGALIVIGAAEGSDRIKRLVQSLFQWRVKFSWYLAVLLGPALMMAVAIFLYNVLDNEGASQNFAGGLSIFPQHILVILSLFLFMLFSVWGEEVGWRGFALLKLQETYHPLLASAILGAIWAAWHLPLFFMEGSPQSQMGIPYFFFATLGYSILYTWVFNGAEESLLIVCLLHAANNTTVSYTMLFFKPLIHEPLFSLTVLGLFDLLIILGTKSTLLYQKRAGNS